MVATPLTGLIPAGDDLAPSGAGVIIELLHESPGMSASEVRAAAIKGGHPISVPATHKVLSDWGEVCDVRVQQGPYAKRTYETQLWQLKPPTITVRGAKELAAMFYVGRWDLHAAIKSTRGLELFFRDPAGESVRVLAL